MTVKEIKESGIIEYYVLGLLSEKEVNEVRGYLEKYPELQQDYKDIQSAMRMYAKANGVPPRDGLTKDITEYIKNNSEDAFINKKTSTENSQSSKKSSSRSIWIYRLLALGLLFSLISKIKSYKALENSKIVLQNECDSIQTEQEKIINIYEALNKPGNNPILITPTDNYQDTKLIFHNNKSEKKNYIQIQILPEVNIDQAFQLWSLKDGVDPIPLTVFKKGDNYILPVDFEEGTQTYAITIEKAEGVQVPTLSRLIGTIGV